MRFTCIEPERAVVSNVVRENCTPLSRSANLSANLLRCFRESDSLVGKGCPYPEEITVKSRETALAGVLVVLMAFVVGQARGADVVIIVSPSTINLSYPGSWVTVHTNIDFALVDAASVTLNGQPISWQKSDAQGDFVAKFTVQSVKDVLEGMETPTDAELTLAGSLTTGEGFSASDTVRVVNEGKTK